MNTVRVNHPILEKLFELEREAARRFPREYDPGLGRIGLLLMRDLPNFGYPCTPTNSRSFAHTGGEGVHFSFLVSNDEINEESPILLTIPAAPKSPTFLVGETLLDFLCLGIQRGFTALENLGFLYEDTVKAYGNPTWRPTQHVQFWTCHALDEQDRAVLELLADRFRLVPWSDPKEKLDRLRSLYRSKLEFFPEGEPGAE